MLMMFSFLKHHTDAGLVLSRPQSDVEITETAGAPELGCFEVAACTVDVMRRQRKS